MRENGRQRSPGTYIALCFSRVYNGTCQDDDNEDGCHDVFNYYQWVPYVLVLMGLLFLLPNQLWKYLEEEKIDSIVKGIKDQQKYDLYERRKIN